MKLTKLLLSALVVLVMIMVAGCLNHEDPVSLDRPHEESKVISFDQGALLPGSYIVILDESKITFTTPNNVLIGRGEQFVLHSDAQKPIYKIAVELLSKHQISATITQVYGTAIKGFAISTSEDEIAKLAGEGIIKYIEQDQRISISGGPPGGGGGGGGGGQTTPYGITRVGGAGDGTGKTAWIIDSGIDLDHNDLNVDVGRSISFLSGGGGNTSPDDQNGHGTHVAGTVGAINNGTGVVGVAANASVVAVRVLDRRGSGSISGVIAGVDYVAASGSNGEVANMSLGGGATQALDDAVLAASQTGVKFAIAAGNSSANANNYSPARVNGPNVYTVSAMDSNDNWASFSNYANPPIDYCAPGVNVNSTWKGNGYNTISGTSMSTPHVAGVLLLGSITSDGTVNGDPDGNPDAIAHR